MARENATDGNAGMRCQKGFVGMDGLVKPGVGAGRGFARQSSSSSLFTEGPKRLLQLQL